MWTLDRIGRSLPHVVGLVGHLQKRGVGLTVLTGDVANTTARLVFGLGESGRGRCVEDPREIGMVAEERWATMTRRPRRNHSPAYKAKAAVAAVRVEKPLAGLAQEFAVHPTRSPNGARSF